MTVKLFGLTTAVLSGYVTWGVNSPGEKRPDNRLVYLGAAPRDIYLSQRWLKHQLDLHKCSVEEHKDAKRPETETSQILESSNVKSFTAR